MKKIICYIINFIKFITVDIWRISSYEENGKRGKLYLTLKTIVLTIRDFYEGKMQVKASALTYYSVFALIPIVAFIFGVARGFGFDNDIAGYLAYRYPAQAESISYIFQLAESYLKHAKGGVFVGIGIIFLLWSILNVFTQIEDSFNEIWRVKKNRTVIRKFTDFFSLLLLIPFLIIVSSSISFYFNHLISYLGGGLYIISPALKVILALMPYIVSWLIFTLIYMIVPNTKVRFSKAAIAGLATGTAFMIFQTLYIWGQKWMTSYNAIYGSLAAIPLLLLFIQITWSIILFGAELSYAGQSVRNFEYESDVKNISLRYYHFSLLALARIIIKRFENGEEPLSMERLAIEYKLPIRLVSVIIDRLFQAGIIIETFSSEKEPAYVPAMDINKITIACFFSRIDTNGSESFNLEHRKDFKEVWEYTARVRQTISRASKDKLVKDL
jgi:membrane protein